MVVSKNCSPFLLGETYCNKAQNINALSMGNYVKNYQLINSCYILFSTLKYITR